MNMGILSKILEEARIEGDILRKENGSMLRNKENLLKNDFDYKYVKKPTPLEGKLWKQHIANRDRAAVARSQNPCKDIISHELKDDIERPHMFNSSADWPAAAIGGVGLDALAAEIEKLRTFQQEPVFQMGSKVPAQFATSYKVRESPDITFLGDEKSLFSNVQRGLEAGEELPPVCASGCMWGSNGEVEDFNSIEEGTMTPANEAFEKSIKSVEKIKVEIGQHIASAANNGRDSVEIYKPSSHVMDNIVCRDLIKGGFEVARLDNNQLLISWGHCSPEANAARQRTRDALAAKEAKADKRRARRRRVFGAIGGVTKFVTKYAIQSAAIITAYSYFTGNGWGNFQSAAGFLKNLIQ